MQKELFPSGFSLHFFQSRNAKFDDGSKTLMSFFTVPDIFLWSVLTDNRLWLSEGLSEAICFTGIWPMRSLTKLAAFHECFTALQCCLWHPGLLIRRHIKCKVIFD